MNNQISWTFNAYDEMNPEGYYMKPVSIYIPHALNEEAALSLAKKVVKRKEYTLTRATVQETDHREEDAERNARLIGKAMKEAMREDDE